MDFDNKGTANAPEGATVSNPLVWNSDESLESFRDRLLRKERLGEASILYVGRFVADVSKALNADGTRDQNLFPGYPGTGMWRRRLGDGSYEHGVLEVTRDDIWFVRQEGVVRPPRPKREDALAAHILGSNTICSALADDYTLSIEVYDALAAGKWRNEELGKNHVGRWNHAAEVVSRARDLGEVPGDFIMSGSEGFLSDEAEEFLADLGWRRTEPPEEDPLKRNASAERILIDAERERPGELPEWYVFWIHGLREGEGLDARAHKAAASGRMTYGQWLRFWELYVDGGD